MLEVSEKEAQACQRDLEELIGRFDSLEGTVLSTPDGLLIATASRNGGIEADAVAAMSASLLSLADALAGQAGRAFADNVISEAESSTLVILHAGEMILTVIGSSGINIGMVLSAAKATARKLHTDAKEFSESVAGKGILADPDALLERVKKEMAAMRRE